MAFFNQQPQILTQAQLNLIAAEVALPGYAGYSVAQQVAALNAPRLAPNPVPQGQVAPPTVAIADVFSLLTQGYESAAFQTLSGTPADANEVSVLTNIFNAVSHYSGSGQSSMPVNLASTWLGEFVKTGLITQAQANAILLVPDPSWPATTQEGPRIDIVLGGDGWAVVNTNGVIG